MSGSVMEPGLADRLFEGLLQIDSRGRIALWSAAAERITGHIASAAVGCHIQQSPVQHFSEAGLALPDTLLPILLTARDGRHRESLVYFLHVDGYRLTALARTGPVFDRWRRLAGAYELFTDNKALIAAFRAAQASDETVLFDALTGIGNRPHIENRVKMAIQDFHEHGSRFGLLFIDIDHFKQFNDTYGHLTGDKVLRATARALRQNLRVSDSCGRWGGEEFIALVHDLEPAGLRKVAEKLRQAVSQATLREHDQSLSVTVSIGASLVCPDDTFQTLVHRCDRLMYESKRLGRDRVSVDD